MTGKWTQEEKDQLVMYLTLAMKGQKTYSKEELTDKLAWYKMKLEGRYTMAQIIYAMDIFTDSNNQVPVPSDIINILNPVKPKITQTEYITAKENWAREGYKSHCYYLGVMREFEAQEGEQRNEAQPITDEKVLSLVNNSIKRIN